MSEHSFILIKLSLRIKASGAALIYVGEPRKKLLLFLLTTVCLVLRLFAVIPFRVQARYHVTNQVIFSFSFQVSWTPFILVLWSCQTGWTPLFKVWLADTYQFVHSLFSVSIFMPNIKPMIDSPLWNWNKTHRVSSAICSNKKVHFFPKTQTKPVITNSDDAWEEQKSSFSILLTSRHNNSKLLKFHFHSGQIDFDSTRLHPLLLNRPHCLQHSAKVPSSSVEVANESENVIMKADQGLLARLDVYGNWTGLR